MLHLELALLTGRYVATAYNDRRSAEWPPHPARLFSALVSAHFSDPARRDAERDVLQWLEAQSPPELAVSDAAPREVVTVFVPVNDSTVVGDLGRYEKEHASAVAELAAIEGSAGADPKATAKAMAKAEKAVATAEKKWRGAVTRSVAAGTKEPSKTETHAAEGLFPEHRTRQPRTFPSVFPERSAVFFRWPDAEPTAAQVEVLDALAARLVRLGHSSSLVSLRVVPSSPAPSLVPREDGDVILRWVGAGQFGRLQAEFDLHQETLPRVLPASFVPYGSPSAPAETAAAESAFDDDWLVLARVGSPRISSESAVAVSAATRGALLAFATEPSDEILSGHGADGKPAQRTHLAIVPIPNVGHPHADGSLLGVALVFPRTATDAERRATFLALAKWEQEARRGQPDEEFPWLELKLGKRGTMQLGRIDGRPRLASLQPQSWCRPARRWHTVTPIALDRNPGDLRARDPKKLAAAIAEAEATIRAACERIGLPHPRDVVIQPAAPVAAARKARNFPPFPGREGRLQRVLTHATLEFDVPVRGPLLVGAGRYWGLGLFRPEHQK